MSGGQNDIAFLDILTKCIKLMDLQGYMASICLWHQYGINMFLLISLFKKGVETNCNKSSPSAKKQ